MEGGRGVFPKKGLMNETLINIKPTQRVAWPTRYQYIILHYVKVKVALNKITLHVCVKEAKRCTE